MSGFSLPLTRLVHENLSVIMTFAYSQRPLVDMLERKFRGHHKYVEKALFELSASRAEKACLELALFLRMVDDDEGITEYYEATKSAPNCGILLMKSGVAKELPFREVSNKIIHAVKIEWNFARDPDPALICHSRDSEKWLRAEVDLVALSFVCGRLMS